jgi:NAD+ synthase (glutamine-hydrolysing)
MKIYAAQLNPTVGDIENNLKMLKTVVLEAESSKADIVVFSELYITGYPPRDLLNKKWFINKVLSAIEDIKKFSKSVNTAILLGVPHPTYQNDFLKLYNSAIVIHKGKLVFRQDKSLLPTYDVFDEARYFYSADKIDIFKFKGKKLGITICEDAWNNEKLSVPRYYNFDPVGYLAEKGAEIFINISASPFFMGKEKLRYQIISNHVKNNKVDFIFINQVGGNDELIFDGRSFAINKKNQLISIFPSFNEHHMLIETESENAFEYIPEDEISTVYNALILGIKDYLRKCGFEKVVIGLSGGIDSAVTAALATDAIGVKNVLCVLMPGPFSSKGSVDDSIKLAKNLGIEYKIISITDIFKSYINTLAPHFEGLPPNIAEENIQARIRGNILMALSNKFNSLVLSTGNKSELAVGYCTLYGDMSGGLAVISDVPKTLVYEIANFINASKEIIPYEIIKKPPSAELRPDQKDEDSLPPYETLDQILHYYIEEGLYEDNIVKLGFDKDIVKWVIKTINRNEYKRKQAAPGLKVTSKAFGVGRRMPIAARY